MHIQLVIAKLVTMVIGLVIALTAYRGYRRTGSEPMRLLGLGFAIISIGAVIEGVLFDVFEFSIFWAGTVQTSIVALGMLFVLYSLHSTGGHSPSELRRSTDHNAEGKPHVQPGRPVDREPAGLSVNETDPEPEREQTGDRQSSGTLDGDGNG